MCLCGSARGESIVDPASKSHVPRILPSAGWKQPHMCLSKSMLESLKQIHPAIPELALGESFVYKILCTKFGLVWFGLCALVVVFF